MVAALSSYANSPAPKGLGATQLLPPWNTNVGNQTMTCTDCHSQEATAPAVQRLHFRGRERPMLSRRQVAQHERANGDPHQAQHLDSQRGERPPDLAVLALVQHDLDPTLARARP